MQISGGVYNGANPPAFDRNRRKEIAELLALPEPEGGSGKPDGRRMDGGATSVSRVTLCMIVILPNFLLNFVLC